MKREDITPNLIENVVGFFDSLPKPEYTVSISVARYTKKDEFIDIHTGTFKEVFDKTNELKSYYYRVAALEKYGPNRKISDVYFGVKVSSLGGLHFNVADYLNNYLNYMVNEYYKYIKGQNSKKHEQYFEFYNLLTHYLWVRNRFLNLKQNTKEGFNAQLNTFLSNHPEFKEVVNLDDYKRISGIYLLVLDKYNVCYLGQSVDIRTRIMSHWSRSNYFTGTGIDLFKAKDTTRIFALECEHDKVDLYEHKLLNEFKSRYVLNCLAGGSIDYILDNDLNLTKKDYDDDFIDYKKRELFYTVDDVKAIKDKFIVESENSNDRI